MLLGRILPSRIASFGQRISQISQSSKEPLTLSTMLKSDSGRTYKIEEVLANQQKPPLCVYRARYIAPNALARFLPTTRKCRWKELHSQKHDSGRVRLPTKPAEIAVGLSKCTRGLIPSKTSRCSSTHSCLSGDLLCLSKRKLPQDRRKSVLRSALHGLADLHDKDILHNGKYNI